MDIESISPAKVIDTNELQTSPLYEYQVPAGFPSPATDFAASEVNLHDYLVKHQAATFFVRAKGDSMIDGRIQSDDLLVVDRSLEAKSGNIVIAALDGDLTVKQLKIKGARSWLVPMNPKFSPIELKEQDCMIWGVVVYIIHKSYP
ncbi:translesion error-prone DNA polymerase V autoproteolytic subunit [Endozoicomonas sp. SM1973]|uniref:Translesion error-prone DNA polymerase V autoproteolytic subunit n=1 Tax=Spartinivicinus marinus TaxID=2994442 RepID=A0A853I1J9_9GAMM|nr:translesion error-prone DNA polymerase V autoproteolytic subunit [Spartinivicinus marinus]MCX4030207.1 translesion error-prone DNA polymerase V autoproteolytic subunit [Spartinivicinus marinus]NYZ67850.1 translesion error-prone DNA polymerase V autoproteolytic subunit [Spartinivicinus marinus]